MSNFSLAFVSIVFSLIILTSIGCLGGLDDNDVYNPYEQYQVDSLIIEDYINQNGLDAFDVEYNGAKYGVYCDITEEGSVDTSLFPDINSTITVKYKGYLIDGTVFDETKGSATYTSPLTNLVDGWKIGFTALSKGDKATLLIPSFYGYGQNGVGDIPVNSVLLFDVELVSFVN